MTSVANTVAMTSFAVHTLQPLIFYRLWAHSPRRNWSETPSLTLLSRESLPGNTVDNAQFSLMARRVAHELTMFCRQDSKFPDVRALACFTDLLDVLNNPCIPNPAYAILTILKINHDHPREKMKMKARKKLAKLEYDPAC